MIKHNCQNCIYKHEPESIRDYYLRSLQYPDLHHWNQTGFKHRYWLCENPNVSKVDGVNGSLICRPCHTYNFNETCSYFKIENAEDILPSTSEIQEPTDPIKVGDEVTIEVINTPFTTEAVTEEKQKLDENGEPLFDEESNPVMETIETEPAFTNEQDITYSYTWYKNNRKLFQKKSSELKVDTSVEATDEYYCIVTQSIENNGDGGNKTVQVKTNTVTIIVEAAEEPEEVIDDTSGN